MLALENELAKRKKVYLFDEVTSALDEEHLSQVMSVLQKQREHSLIVMATHDKRILDCGEKIFLTPSLDYPHSGKELPS